MLSYTITGSLKSPPLIFLHGFLGVKEDWEETISYLKEDFCCYAFDLPGHGDSPYEDHFLESLLTSFNHLKLFPSVLVGYSLGGRLALFLKEYFPDCFTKLILLGAHPGLSCAHQKTFRWQQDLHWSLMLETQPFTSFLEAWYAQPLFASLKQRPELLAHLIQKRSLQNPSYMASILRNFSLSHQPHITKFALETLFLYGDQDVKFAELYEKELPKNVAVEKIKGGHILPLENPKEVMKKIRTFV